MWPLGGRPVVHATGSITPSSTIARTRSGNRLAYTLPMNDPYDAPS